MALTDYVKHDHDVTLVGYRDPEDDYYSGRYWDVKLNDGTIISVADSELDDYIKFFKKLKKKSEDK